MSKLTLATCQFPVCGDVRANAEQILRLMASARRRGAALAHFPETCLPGYGGLDFTNMSPVDWASLRMETERIMRRAAELGLWVVLGSMHQLTGQRKPHNCLYVIDERGRLVTRYDKLFCFGRAEPDPTLDFLYYSPGSETVSFEVQGARIGMLICHDFRYPELYREYKRLGAHLVLHSYYNARMTPAELPYYTAQVRAASIAAAASSHLWISVSNASAPLAHPSFVVRPDGSLAGQLRRHRAGALITNVDTEIDLWDASRPWRDQCLCGVLHSGEAASDARSSARTEL